MRIHIETDNIYYKNNDTNQSSFEFVKNQHDSSKGKINFDLTYDENYNDYLIWCSWKIQNQNWQYFLERVIAVCKSKEIGSTNKKSEDFLLNTVENVTIAKKSYETFYNVVERNFYSTMSKLSMDERDKIKDEFLRELLGRKCCYRIGLLNFILLSTWKISRFTKIYFNSKSEFTLFFKNWYANFTCWFI